VLVRFSGFMHLTIPSFTVAPLQQPLHMRWYIFLMRFQDAVSWCVFLMQFCVAFSWCILLMNIPDSFFLCVFLSCDTVICTWKEEWWIDKLHMSALEAKIDPHN
jgi:hypothetical protein